MSLHCYTLLAAVYSMLHICLHAGVANCELTKDFPSVTSPLSPPCSADLRYPVMESNERHKKVDNSFLFITGPVM